jgi:hypothetical protein
MLCFARAATTLSAVSRARPTVNTRHVLHVAIAVHRWTAPRQFDARRRQTLTVFVGSDDACDGSNAPPESTSPVGRTMTFER